jgi:predicted Rossmann fold nucleotide-binding protein DprA/Smf involved in DNA uptake
MNVSRLSYADGSLSPTAQATLLLTCYFSKASSETSKPLTIPEWARFAWWLKEKSATPADLLGPNPKALLQGWYDKDISTERILELLNRGHSLALAMEKWQRAGLWVVTRSDPEYPARLKQRLKTSSPPVLFGCGKKALLNSGGLAVIGSRSANDADLDFTDQIGAKAASEQIAIVSGGARGVDETAMLGAINHGGVVIGIMADSLLKTATSSKWRKGLMDGHAVLVSPFYPEAGFNAGNAMARNKYIYCLADSSLVIHSGRKGGTLNGAEENLKYAWVPLWVKPTMGQDAANADLVVKGGRWLSTDIQELSIAGLMAKSGLITRHGEIQPQADLFTAEQVEESSVLSVSKGSQLIESEKRHGQQTFLISGLREETACVDFYQMFTNELLRLAKEPVSVERLVKSTGLNKAQLNDWLKRAESDGFVRKLDRPIRYQIGHQE